MSIRLADIWALHRMYWRELWWLCSHNNAISPSPLGVGQVGTNETVTVISYSDKLETINMRLSTTGNI